MIEIKKGNIGFLMEGVGKWANKTPKICLINNWGKYEFKVYYPEFDEFYSHLTSNSFYSFRLSSIKVTIKEFKELYKFFKMYSFFPKSK